MSDQIECTCHRDGNCMCAELGEMNAEGNTWCSVCETLDEHCECGCTCNNLIKGACWSECANNPMGYVNRLMDYCECKTPTPRMVLLQEGCPVSTSSLCECVNCGQPVFIVASGMNIDRKNLIMEARKTKMCEACEKICETKLEVLGRHLEACADQAVFYTRYGTVEQCAVICENMGKEVVCPEECAVAIRKLNEDNPCC